MKNITPELISSLISDIYDCAIEPDGWTATLTRFADIMDAAYASIHLSSLQFQEPFVAAHSPWDAAQLKNLNENFGIEIPGLPEIVYGSLDTPGSSMDRPGGEHHFQTSRFYKEWVAPQGLRDACMCKFAQTDDRIGIAAVVTSASRELITRQEHELMQLLAPHFRRAAMIGDLLNTQRMVAQSYRSLIDALTSAVILTDKYGKVHQINAAADNILAQGTALSLEGGYIKAGQSVKTSAIGAQLQHIQSLNQAIELAALGDTQLGQRGIGITLQASGQSPLVAYVLPLQTSELRSSFNTAAVAIFLCSRETALPHAEALLSTLYALTPAEIRVFQQLVKGQSAKEIASVLFLSESTVNTHTKHLFAKTNTHKQTQLIALATSLTPPLAKV